MKKFANHFTYPLYILVLLCALPSCGKGDDPAKQKAAEEAKERIARYEGNLQTAKECLDEFHKHSDEPNAKKLTSALKTLSDDMEALVREFGITTESLKEIASRDGDPQLSEAELGQLKNALTKKKLTPEQKKELEILKENLNLLQEITNKHQEYKDKLLALEERKVKVREDGQKTVSSYLSFRKTFASVMAGFQVVAIVILSLVVLL